MTQAQLIWLAAILGAAAPIWVAFGLWIRCIHGLSLTIQEVLLQGLVLAILWLLIAELSRQMPLEFAFRSTGGCMHS